MASKKKKIDMASKWDHKERQTKRLAIILSVVLHLAVITALSVDRGANGESGLKNLIESVFGGEDEQSQTADLEQS